LRSSGKSGLTRLRHYQRGEQVSTLCTSEQTHQGVPAQSLALESVSADNPQAGTKRGVDARSKILAIRVQHGRGETSQTVAWDDKRHPLALGSPCREEVRGLATPRTTPAPNAVTLSLNTLGGMLLSRPANNTDRPAFKLKLALTSTHNHLLMASAN